MARGGQQGRIHTHQRDTNDVTPVLEDKFLVDHEHQEIVQTTENLEINVALQIEYRNRIGHIYKFLQSEYPDYYAVGVRVLTEEEKEDPNQFWNRNDHDLVYSSLNIKFIKAFLAERKTKSNGKMCSNSNIHKYKDAILWGQA